MTARLVKETRDLLPLCIGTVALMVVPYVVWGRSAEGFGCFAFGLGCAVMAASSFGSEFQRRTLGLLLSQPLPRRVIWREKMFVLGAALVTCLAVLCACFKLAYPEGLADGPIMALVLLCAFCGAPYWTLKARQSITGMTISAGFPGMLLMANALLTWWLFKNDSVSEFTAAPLILVYCAVVYGLGYAEFKRLQVVDGVARELTLPGWAEARLVRPLSRISAGFTSPFACLVKKELRLQQVSFLVAGVFALIALAGASLHPVRPDIAVGTLAGALVLEVLLVPLLAGALAVAEEKGWGVADWHLMLPPSAGKQWLAKMGVTLSTSVVLGVLLPTGLYLLCALAFSEPGQALPPRTQALVFSERFIIGVVAQMMVTGVAVYAASFSNSALRAILAAFCLLLAMCVSVGPLFGLLQVTPILVLGNLQSRQWFTAGLGLLLLLGCFLGFAFGNFRRRGLPARRFAVQGLVILLLLWTWTILIIRDAPYF